MKSTFNWHTIRAINNSQNEGFEELVCQLAYREYNAIDKEFRRIGKPDGGKECFWNLDDSLHMWQAKFFTSTFATGQWKQIDKSVKAALDNHSNLKHYYLCIPLDLPDGKTKGRSSLLTKYNEKTKEWTEYAKAKDMDVTFHYWGNSELLARLSKRENEGLNYFWFNSEELLDSWFDHKNQESINALGARYNTDLNIKLSLTDLFEGLSQSSTIEADIKDRFKKILVAYKQFDKELLQDDLLPEKAKVTDQITQLKDLFNELRFIKGMSIDYKPFYSCLTDISDTLDTISTELYLKRDELDNEKLNIRKRAFSDEIEAVSSFSDSIDIMQWYFDSDLMYLANNPYLLLTGDAGSGKSHLLADVVVKSREEGQISLLLLGENFVGREAPWTQILYNQLRLQNCDEFVFLGALNAKAEARGSRILLFIDALNEGQGRVVWPKNLKTLIETVKKYKWLGLILSVRSTYEQLIAPQDVFGDDTIMRREHNGFANEDYSVTEEFFRYYEIALPDSPVLNPEYHNPLFLSILCKSLKARGLHYLPEGFEGITTIINFFLDTVNYKLAKMDELHYDERRNLVYKAVKEIISAMVYNSEDYLKYELADALVDGVFVGKCGNNEPFLQRLVSEGIFNIDLHWDHKGESFEVIYLAYQRFQDQLYTRELLAQYFNAETPELSFTSRPLAELFKDEKSCIYNRNIVEAMLIQIPEITGREFFSIIPHIQHYKTVSQAWIKSLILRKPDAVGEEALLYVNNVIIKNDQLFKQFLLVVISVSMKPGYQFNADSLHNFLFKQKMAQRDSYWTVWLQDKYGPDAKISSISRLIDWAWQDDSKPYLSKESRLLCATAISWLLTSSNRYLRDAATKALVCLYQDHIDLISELLDKFSGVNDPYVTERLYAGAYGAVLRSKNLSGLNELASYVSNNFFKRGYISPNILMRDYARGVVEYALFKGMGAGIKIKNIRPPYRSKPLPAELPTIEEIDQKYKPKGDSGNYGGNAWGAGAILKSMTTEYGRGTARYGDFGRYTFESAFYNFNIDADGLSNLAVEQIFKMGYDVKKFSRFDAAQGSGRSAGHKERIGKKYQWIAFYELLGRVSDHCTKADPDSWEDKEEQYTGPWSPYVRDIDPTIIIKQTGAVRFGKNPPEWWFKGKTINSAMANKKWLADKNDLLKVPELISVNDCSDVEWLWLNCQIRCGEEEKLEEDDGKAKKSITYELSSFIVKETDKVKIRKGLPLVRHRDIPEAVSRYEIFSREYYWSPAHHYFFKPYFRGERWQKLYTTKGVFLGEAHRTAEYYLWEESYDCSKEETIAYYKPSDLLFDGMGLSIGTAEGEYVDCDGNVVCLDPSVNNKSSQGLLVRAEPLRRYLSENKMTLFWSVYTEKLVYGNLGRASETGRTTYNGFFHLEGEQIVGKLTCEKE